MSEELVRRFESPSPSYGPVPLWWWSGEKLEPARLRWQMEQLLAQNVHQAVVMNLAPTGPLYGALADDPAFMSEEWWQIFVGACEDAEELGFQIWLYDQIGFSGANIQGTLVASNPGLAGQALGRVTAAVSGRTTLQAPEGTTPIAAWYLAPGSAASQVVDLDDRSATVEEDGGELVVAFSAMRGFDYFSADASAALIDAIFGEYSRHVGQYFGTAIGGVFQDELPDLPSWSTRFAAEFERMHGYDLIAELPALWGDPLPLASGRNPGVVRIDYHRTRAQLGEDAFFTPLAEWLAGAGLECGFDQQSPAREGNPSGATRLYGDYLSTHAQYGIPGSDHWGDSKIHSSMAHANGHERVWIESFHSSGWGGTLEETYDWLSPYFRRGANLYDPHAVYYSTRSGWFEWAPPSTCWRQPYWPAYGEFATAVARISSTLTMGEHRASTLLFYPTEDAQFDMTVDARDLGDGRASTSYHELNGSTSWFAERRGILETAGVDYDILGGDTVSRASIADGSLIVGSGRFVNVVLPEVRCLTGATAGVLLDFVGAGGLVVCVGELPSLFTGGTDEDAHTLADGFAAALRSGGVRVVESAADVPTVLAKAGVEVVSDAPAMLRAVGDGYLVALIAHDERTGTVQPLLPGFEDEAWVEGGGSFNWKVYWKQLSEDGYTFVPPTGRTFTATVTGVGDVDLDVQQWDPRTGARFAVPFRRDGGSVTVDSTFSSGSIEFLVIAPGLPAPTSVRPGDVVVSQELDGEWAVEARSTLDNQWGDLGPVSETGTLAVQVWQFEHTSSEHTSSERTSSERTSSEHTGSEHPEPAATDAAEAGAAATVTATFGPFAEVAGPDGVWRPAVWSLSRGIQNDTIHDDSLGPNGYVPEEFVHFANVRAGEVHRLRATIAVPGGEPLSLVVGANARRRVLLDGVEVVAAGEGYLTVTPVEPSPAALLELEFTALDDQPIRASFALTSHVSSYARPEWIVPADGFSRSSGVTFRTTFDVGGTETDTRIQVSSEAPTIIVVNGVEVGRQGDFDPYTAKRFTRVHPYDIASAMVEGTNTLEVNCVDVGRPVALRIDSLPQAHGGLGMMTTTEWQVSREGAPIAAVYRLAQWEDPRYGCIVPRPHPLQAASWLESESASGSVRLLVPDARPLPGRVETLSFTVPLGATRLTVPTVVPFTVPGASELAVTVEGTVVGFAEPAPFGCTLTLEFHPVDGRRGGALLDGPVEAEVSASTAPLLPWSDFGLGAMGGEVHYRRTIRVSAGTEAPHTVLDLGQVRGTASILVDGALVQTLFAGPWVADLSEAVTSGVDHELSVVVRGTLAPYLQYASPTSAVMAGQTVHGLFGPVRLESRAV